MTEDKKTILVVDDDHDLTDVLGDKLEAEGYAVLRAYDGGEGLKVALEKHPDLILLDVMMPQIDGWGVIDKLKQDEWGKRSNFILLTNLSDMESISKAMEKQAFRYFVKSDLTLDEIVGKVRHELGEDQ